MSKFLMLDLETLDIKNTSIVLSIGACAFDIDKIETIDNLKYNSFYEKLDVFEQEKVGRTVSLNTISWWLNQETSLKDLIKEDKDIYKNPIGRSLNYLNNFINYHNPDGIWSNGPSFDMNIITSLYNDFNMVFPIDFRKWYDMRTCKLIATMLKLNIPSFSGTKHNALDDALNQASFINNVLFHVNNPQYRIANPVMSKSVQKRINRQMEMDLPTDDSEYDGPRIEDLDLIVDMNSD